MHTCASGISILFPNFTFSSFHSIILLPFSFSLAVQSAAASQARTGYAEKKRPSGRIRQKKEETLAQQIDIIPNF
jgi:hypothetical protein